MDLEGILSITGKPGLFKLVGRTNSGIIVEELDSGKRMPVHSTGKVSALSDISIYGLSEDKPLEEIYELLYKHAGGKTLEKGGSADEMRAKLQEIFPEYDEDRVYTSDLKKLYKWYNLLVDKGFFEKDDDPKDDKKEEETGEKKDES